MSRALTLSRPAPPLDERRRRIESEPLPPNIAALIDEVAEAGGDRLAWNFFESGETITYAELRRQVHGLARGLAGIGVAKGTHVAVMLPNVAAFPLTWLAIGTLGAVMIPVNVGYQPRELRFVLDSGDAEFAVVDEAFLPMLETCIAEGAVRVARESVVVRGSGGPGMHDWDTLAQPSDEAYQPAQPVHLDDLLNIQFTSGTTGFPKGCMLTQRYWLTSGKVNAFRDGRSYARILASTPFYYMDPQWLLLMAFYHRATLFVAARQSTSRFTSWLREHRVQFCLFPMLVHKNPPSAHDRLDDVVRGNVYGVAPALHAKIEERFDFCAREAFGMTELGSAMFMPIEATDMVGSGSCGVPVAFRECRIVDADDQPVPRGSIGELCVRGPGMMLGYYKNPEATRQALRGGWFHTGDLFRQDDLGYFYIVGRQKDMIRRSSENIAAREVEAVLNSIALVLESAAVPVPDDVRGEEVKAYVVLRDGGSGDPQVLEEIIKVCQAQLARFKVPRYFSFRSELPKTASMKVAKQDLLASARDGVERTYDRVAGGWLGSGLESAR